MSRAEVKGKVQQKGREANIRRFLRDGAASRVATTTAASSCVVLARPRPPPLAIRGDHEPLSPLFEDRRKD